MKPSHATSASPFAIWFGLLGGAFAWFLQLLLIYSIAEFGCESPLKDYAMFGIGAVAWLSLAVSAGMFLVALLATGVAYGNVRKKGPDDGSTSLARAGYIANGTFMIAIIVEAVPIFYYLNRC